MVHVRQFSKMKGQVIDEFLFAKYLETDENRLTIFRCLQEYLNKYDIPLENVIVVRKWLTGYGRALLKFCHISQRKSSGYKYYSLCVA